MVVGLLGVLKAGGAYVPLDPSLPAPSAWPSCCEDARVARARSPRSACADALPAHGAQRRAAWTRDWDAIAARAPSRRPARACAPDEPRLRHLHLGLHRPPKGVLLTHRGLVQHRLACHARLRLRPRQPRPAVRLHRLRRLRLRDLLGAAAGGRHAGASPRARTLMPGAPLRPLLRAAEAITAAHAHALGAGAARRPTGPARAARRLISGGEALLRRAGGALRRQAARLLNAYGPTESHRLRHAVAEPVRCPASGIPIGRPFANARVYVLDARAAAGARGRARRAVHRRRGPGARLPGPPGADGRALRPRPVQRQPGARLYRTGDLVRWLAGRARWSSWAASTTR